FSSRRRHTRSKRDWSSDVCSSDLLMGSGSLHKFDTIDDGIDAAAKNLYDLYFSKGLKTVDKIQKKYAPLGVANDPDNLNANWAPTIKKIMKTIDGKDSESDKGCSDDSSSDGKGFDFRSEERRVGKE